jgi:hypothetical protein
VSGVRYEVRDVVVGEWIIHRTRFLVVLLGWRFRLEPRWDAPEIGLKLKLEDSMQTADLLCLDREKQVTLWKLGRSN